MRQHGREQLIGGALGIVETAPAGRGARHLGGQRIDDVLTDGACARTGEPDPLQHPGVHPLDVQLTDQARPDYDDLRWRRGPFAAVRGDLPRGPRLGHRLG